jgi:site-specific DNA-cytosine methylase
MDFVHEGKSYSITPQLLGVLNGFPVDYDWGTNRAQAAAGIGNAVVPRMAEILSSCLL